MSDNEIEIVDDGNDLENMEFSFDEVEDQSIVSSVKLLEMLDNNDYAEFNRVIALPTTLEDTDDLTVIVRNCNLPAGKKNLIKMLTNFLCCLAAESLDSTITNTFDQNIKLATAYEMWKDCINLKKEFISGVLRLFKDN
jgi:hypothetical protein